VGSSFDECDFTIGGKFEEDDHAGGLCYYEPGVKFELYFAHWIVETVAMRGWENFYTRFEDEPASSEKYAAYFLDQFAWKVDVDYEEELPDPNVINTIDLAGYNFPISPEFDVESYGQPTFLLSDISS
jgi:hypothetical protein